MAASTAPSIKTKCTLNIFMILPPASAGPKYAANVLVRRDCRSRSRTDGLPGMPIHQFFRGDSARRPQQSETQLQRLGLRLLSHLPRHGLDATQIPELLFSA